MSHLQSSQGGWPVPILTPNCVRKLWGVWRGWGGVVGGGGSGSGGGGWLVGWLLPLCPGARPGPPRLEATGGRGCVRGGGGIRYRTIPSEHRTL